jgi:hypothetical protein
MLHGGSSNADIFNFNQIITFCPIQFLFVLIGIRMTGCVGILQLLGNVDRNDPRRKAAFPDAARAQVKPQRARAAQRQPSSWAARK